MADDLVKTDRLVTVFGGSGFIGRHVVRALAQRGWRVRVAVRRPDLAFHLQPLGDVGQIHAVQANLRYPDSVARALRDAEAAVKLVGILQETGAQRFDAIQHLGAQTAAKAVNEAGLGVFVQMSAEVATLRRINEFVLKVTQRRRRLVSVSFESAKLLAFVTQAVTKLSLGLFPEIFRITRDQVELLRVDNIVSPQAVAEGRTLRGLGIEPEAFETFVPAYLYRYRKTGQFAGTRAL